MTHFHSTTTRAEMTPSEWLPVGSQLGELVNDWANRSDLVAYVGPGAGGSAPACYNPKLAEVEVNVDVAFGKGISPEMIGNLARRSVQFEWPKATGAIFHEALHARYSRWDLEAAHNDLDEKTFAAINLLEETRIEAAGVKSTPKNRPFLRACALDIVLADVEENLSKVTTTRAAAQLAGLTLARVDAGVLKREDVDLIAELIEPLLGEELLKGLRSIWNRFQMHDDHRDSAPLYELAAEWVKLVEDAATKRDEDSGSEKKMSDEMKKLIKDMMEALGEAGEMTAIAAGDDLAEQEQAEQWSEIASKKSQESSEKGEHKKEASKIFSKGTGPQPASPSWSQLHEKRKPTPKERAAAVQVATMLEKAKYRERDMHEISSVTPPGRLRTRAMVQGAALKSKGVMSQTEPWRRHVRKHTDEPTLKVGVMVDISGSMSSAMQPMAVTAWVMSEAARRVQATAAMVYYGSDVFPTLKPGQHLTDVNVYTAPDGTEKFDKAFKAIDGGLNLLHGTGARLLVIVSDGHYTPSEQAAAKNWMRRCQDAGVAVLWLPFETHSFAARLVRGTDAVLLEGRMDPAAAATQIGKAAADALMKVSTRAAA